MDGRVYVCAIGANLRCDAKAERAKRNAGADNYCRENPNATFVPACATGHDTIYAWSCSAGNALPGKRAIMLVGVAALRAAARESWDHGGISPWSRHKQAPFAGVCTLGPQRKLLEHCCTTRQKLHGALRILGGVYQAHEGAQL